MVLENLYLKRCIVCGVRCDIVGKQRLMELKTPEILTEVQSLQRKNSETLKIGDTMCRKHENQILRNKNKSTLNASLFDSPDPILNSTPPSFDSESFAHSYGFEENTQDFYSNCSTSVHEDFNENEHSFVIVDMPRTYASHSFCFLCKAKSGKIQLFH